MDRRNFLKAGGSVITLPFLLNGFHINLYGKDTFWGDVAKLLSATNKKLVLIQMGGGNDGLNTVIPIDQYDTYYSYRQNIAIPENKILKFTDAIGIHPAMTGLKELYDTEKLALINAVSYPNPNLSHFRATDIWTTGSGYDQYLRDGWLGRYLQNSDPNYPNNITEGSHPLAIQIGGIVSKTLQGDKIPMGVAVSSPQNFYNIMHSIEFIEFNNSFDNQYGQELDFLHNVHRSSYLYSTVVRDSYDKAKNQVEYPTSNSLATQLSTVARLIAGGLTTNIYIVTIGGFDTHSNQTDGTDTTIGSHSNLLSQMSSAMFSFQHALNLLGVENDVITMTFTDFGRRAKSNGSRGTDHGTATPIFVMGNSVNPLIFGTNPDLNDLETGILKDNIKRQFDFRQIYASIFAQWFGVSNDLIAELLYGDFNQINLIKTTSVYEQNGGLNKLNFQIYPNPITTTSEVRYFLPENSNVSIKLYNLQGNEYKTLVNTYQPSGEYAIMFNAQQIPSGNYYLQLNTQKHKATQKVIIAR